MSFPQTIRSILSSTASTLHLLTAQMSVSVINMETDIKSAQTDVSSGYQFTIERGNDGRTSPKKSKSVLVAVSLTIVVVILIAVTVVVTIAVYLIAKRAKKSSIQNLDQH